MKTAVQLLLPEMDGIAGFYEARTDRVLCVRCAGRPTRAGTPIPEPDCGTCTAAAAGNRGASSAATNPTRRRDCSRSAAAPGRRARWLHAYRVRPRLRRR